MIIIGSTELTFTRSTGDFHCPQCDQSREYRHRYRREFLTIYFIPLIPLRTLGEFLECSECKESFETNVKEMTAEEIRASKRRATMEMVRRVLVVIVAADDEVSEDELEAVSEFARQVELPEVSGEQIWREAMAVRQADMNVLDYIQHVANQLSTEDKELLVAHAFLAATAAGELSPTRQQLLQKLPEATGVPEWRFREIVADVAERP